MTKEELEKQITDIYWRQLSEPEFVSEIKKLLGSTIKAVIPEHSDVYKEYGPGTGHRPDVDYTIEDIEYRTREIGL